MDHLLFHQHGITLFLALGSLWRLLYPLFLLHQLNCPGNGKVDSSIRDWFADRAIPLHLRPFRIDARRGSQSRSYLGQHLLLPLPALTLALSRLARMLLIHHLRRQTTHHDQRFLRAFLSSISLGLIY